LAESKEKMIELLDSQNDITEVYQEMTYDELKSVLESWLNPDSEEESEEEASTSAQTLSSTTSKDEAPFEAPTQPKVEPAKPASNKKLDDVASAFDDLFNS
jgi:hypothetical protein